MIKFKRLLVFIVFGGFACWIFFWPHEGKPLIDTVVNRELGTLPNSIPTRVPTAAPTPIPLPTSTPMPEPTFTPQPTPTRVLSRNQNDSGVFSGTNTVDNTNNEAQTREEIEGFYREYVEQNYIVVPNVDLGPYGSGGRYEIIWHIWSARLLSFAILFSLLLLWPVAYVKAKRHEVDKRHELELRAIELEAAKSSPRPIVQNRHIGTGGLQTVERDGEVSEDDLKTFVANFRDVGLNPSDWDGLLEESVVIDILNILAERNLITPVRVGLVSTWVGGERGKIRDVTRALGLN